MKTTKLLLNGILIIGLSCFFQFVQAQSPQIKWQKCIGGSKDDYANSITRLANGNYLTCGNTISHDGDFHAVHKGYDAFLMETDGAGNILWEKTYGGSNDEVFLSAFEAGNGDLYAIGYTASDDGQVSGHHGAVGTNDVWLVQTDKNGKLLSQHCYGGSGDESNGNFKVIMSAEGNLVFAAATNSTDGDVTNNHGDYDGWVVKLNSKFGIEWAVTIGDATYDDLSSIDEIRGNFVVTGTRAAVSSDTPHLEKYYDAHAAEIDQAGHIIWQRIYGGTRSDDCNFSVSSGDGGEVLAGHTSSNDGDVSANNGFNMWIWKINATNGDIMWQNYFGQPADTAAAFNLFATHDGGFVLVGAIAPNEELPLKTWDAYTAKVDANGHALWTKRFGGSKYDAINGGVEEKNGSLLLAGSTASTDGDVSGFHGGFEDVWLVNLSGNCDRVSSSVEAAPVIELKSFPNPFSGSTTITFSLPQSENVSLNIFDDRGRLITTLADRMMGAGVNSLQWNAHDQQGNAVSAGIYFLKISTDGKSEMLRLSVVK